MRVPKGKRNRQRKEKDDDTLDRRRKMTAVAVEQNPYVVNVILKNQIYEDESRGDPAVFVEFSQQYDRPNKALLEIHNLFVRIVNTGKDHLFVEGRDIAAEDLIAAIEKRLQGRKNVDKLLKVVAEIAEEIKSDDSDEPEEKSGTGGGANAGKENHEIGERDGSDLLSAANVWNATQSRITSQ